MMTTKSVYALMAMMDIANNSLKGPVSMEDIAQRQNLSPAYLAKILNKLKKAGLLMPMRGHYGGYVLSAEAKRIPVTLIIKAVEKNITLVDGVKTDDENLKNKEYKGLVKLFEKVDVKVSDILSATTLGDLL